MAYRDLETEVGNYAPPTQPAVQYSPSSVDPWANLKSSVSGASSALLNKVSPQAPGKTSRMQSVATPPKKGSKNGKKMPVNPLYDLALLTGKGADEPTVVPDENFEIPPPPSSPGAEEAWGGGSIETGDGALIPADGAQEIDSEATAPAQVQGQQQPSPYYNPRLAELAGNRAYREEDAAAFDARNPEAAAKFAGNKAMQEYLNQRLTRERDVHPFRRFVTGVANAIPANDTSALGHFARGYRGVRGEYDKEQKAQEATMGELAGVQGDQAVYDAIMKRGQEAGQFYNPQEAGEFERLQMEQKMQLDAVEAEAKRLRDAQLLGWQNESRNMTRTRYEDWLANKDNSSGGRAQKAPPSSIYELDLPADIKKRLIEAETYGQLPAQYLPQAPKPPVKPEPTSESFLGLDWLNPDTPPSPEAMKEYESQLKDYPNQELQYKQAMRQRAMDQLMLQSIKDQYGIDGRNQPAQQANPQQELIDSAQALVQAGRYPTIEEAVAAIQQRVNGR